MIFLNPWALLGLPILGLVVWLHARRPRKTLPVSNLYLWQKAGDLISRQRPILERIRKNRLLMLRLAFCLCLILALARPSLLFWNQSHAFVLVFDCSASMNARERGGTRIELAREKARQLLDGLNRNDRVIIVQAKPQPVVSSFAGSDKRNLNQALQALTAGAQSADLTQALMMGISSIDKTEPCQAYVFSDGTQSALLPNVSRQAHFIQTGESDNNAAISRLAIRSNPFSPHDQEIFAEAVNFSSRPMEFRWQISSAETSLFDETVKLGSMERKQVAIQAPASGSGIVKAEIHVEDALDEDNHAAVTPDFKISSVLLATAGNQFLENALRVNPRVTLTVMDPVQYARSEPETYDVVILDGIAAAPAKRPGCLIIEPPAGNRVPVGRAPLSPRPNHPVMAFIRLNDARIDEAHPLKVRPSETVLIEVQGMPLLAVSELGTNRIARLGFDFRDSSMPLTVSFPILISNLTAWLDSSPDGANYSFSEQESRIGPGFTREASGALKEGQPVWRQTGREIRQWLLLLSLGLLAWIWHMERHSRKVKSLASGLSALRLFE